MDSDEFLKNYNADTGTIIENLLFDAIADLQRTKEQALRQCEAIDGATKRIRYRLSSLDPLEKSSLAMCEMNLNASSFDRILAEYETKRDYVNTLLRAVEKSFPGKRQHKAS